MKLPARVEYACRAVIELSLRYDYKAPVQIGAISESQKVPKGFLLQLLIRLKNAGIVESTRGLAGGYSLAKPPSKVKLAEVIRAVDDTIIPKLTFKSGAKKTVRTSDPFYEISNIWEDLNRQIATRLEKVTFEDIIAGLEKRSLTYYI